MNEFLEVDPSTLHLPFSHWQGAVPWKLQRPIAMNQTFNPTDVLDGLRLILDRVPQLRLGQLVCNLASQVDEAGWKMPWQASDDELLAAIRQLLSDVRGRDFQDCEESDSSVRETLINSLELLSQQVSNTHIGVLVSHLAFSALGISSESVWDVEDQELIEQVQRELSRPRLRLVCREEDFALPEEAEALHTVAN